MTDHYDWIEQISHIKALDKTIIDESKMRWDSLTKPPGSLGKLETVISQIAAIQGTLYPCLDQKTVLCFAADHGVVQEGVSPSKQVVTSEMVLNFLNGGAAISVLSKYSNCKLKVVDVGMVYPQDHPDVIQKSIAKGTANFRKERAMTLEQAQKAIHIGFSLAEKEIRNGVHILLSGEMGVGNTSSASAIYSAITGLDPAQITGCGAGLNPERLAHKIKIIRESLDRHKVDKGNPLEILSCVGGFELAAMTGLMLAAAVHSCPVVVDGYISGASALLAMTFNPLVKDYLIFSHQSGEAGFAEICQRWNIPVLVDLNMRLGEGTGAVMILPLIESSLSCYLNMATFAEAGVTEVEQ